MRKITMLSLFIILCSSLHLNAQENHSKTSYHLSASFNLMGAFLGMYGGSFELKIIDRFFLEINGYYSGYSLQTTNGLNGYWLVSLNLMPRLYLINDGPSGLWLSVGSGIKLVTITQADAAYYGRLVMLHLGIGYKILFGNFFIEPYGGYSFAGGEVADQPQYKGEASLYGANIGFVF